jgi:uncharacterized protein (DUF362 family)
VKPLEPTVILRRCGDYDPERIRRLTGEALDALDLRPHGRTLVKPNAVASGRYFPNAYTRPEFLEGVLQALVDRGAAMRSLTLGERCGITVPTRFAFSEAGYYALGRRVPGLRFSHFEEEPQVCIPLEHEGRLRDYFYTPEPVASADFFVNCPKFKAHPWTTVTFSQKNYIGIQDDRHRLIDHDHWLERKVADLQFILQPQFIAIDAIVAGEGRMLTPLPFDLGLVAFGNNQVAFDAVCCRIAGVDPREVEHIRVAHARGFGPIDTAHIRVIGDLSLEEAAERATGFRTGLIRVDDYFRGTHIRAYGGRPPGDTHDYCWGGCPGALEEAIEILRIVDEATDEKMPPVHLVFGEHRGEIPARDGEKVVFIGDCARFEGEIGGQLVNIQSRYVDRADIRPEDATEEDIFVKMWKVGRRFRESRKEQVLRLGGCPVSVAEQVLALVFLGGLKNPYLQPATAVPFVSAYLSSRSRTALRRVLGQPYHRPGLALRGAARPRLAPGETRS